MHKQYFNYFYVMQINMITTFLNRKEMKLYKKYGGLKNINLIAPSRALKISFKKFSCRLIPIVPV